LFQFLKYFPGETEIWGAIVIPGLVFGIMFLMPFIGKWEKGHRFNVAYLFIVLGGAGLLTYLAYLDDHDPKDTTYIRAVATAHEKSERVVELIRGQNGIGHQPARVILQNDPKTHGPEVFARNCSACHSFDGHDGTGHKLAEPATASDLGQFGTRSWIQEFIKKPAGPKYFGPTVNGSFNGKPIGSRFTEGEMAEWSADNVPNMKPEELEGVVEFLLAQGGRTDFTAPDPEKVKVGRNFFENGSENASACSDCHGMKMGDVVIGDIDTEYYPQLTGYGSEEWLKDFLMNPGAGRHYGDRNAMPSFKDRMTEKDFEILTRWLRHRWYEPEGKQAQK
jgi:ubiquinol-cytochrome c reductase cytochrome b subunit